jgi:hypothetical protein
MQLPKPDTPIFDYRTLRLAMGVIALSLPLLVTFISAQKLESISASYYTDSRNIFVGLMFVVAAFLFAYNGWTTLQAFSSKFAALGAAMVALFPTSCKLCGPSLHSTLHALGAALLFGILAYFCLGPFREKTKGQGGKKALRSKIYLVCGLLIIGAMLTVILIPDQIKEEYRIVFWGEAVALSAFGVAWIVAGKYLSPLVHPDEKLYLFKKPPEADKQP